MDGNRNNGLHALEPSSGITANGRISKDLLSIACLNCANTKLRCDRQYPCERCLKKRLQCVPRHRRRVKSATANRFVTWPNPAEENALDVTIASAEVALPPQSNEASNNLYDDQTRGLSAPYHASAPTELHSSLTQARHNGDHRHNTIGENANDRLSSTMFARPSAVAAANDDGLSGRSPPTNATAALTTPVAPSPERTPDSSLEFWDRHLFSGLVSPMTMPTQSVHTALHLPQDSRLGSVDVVASRTNDFRSEMIDQDQPTLMTTTEAEELIVNWQHWSLCRCNPAPRYPAKDRAKSAIVKLDDNYMQSGPWSSIDAGWRSSHYAPSEIFTNAPLSDASREWLLMIVQRLMRVAMDIHGLTLDGPSPASPQSDEFTSFGGFLRLPPSAALHSYLENVLRYFEPFYPLVPARSLDPDRLADAKRGRGSNLLLFLMFAFGSMTDPAVKARRFSMALTEICRHTLHDALERDTVNPTSGLLFYSALVFTLSSCFGGDKAHMNIAVGHRYMYLTAMRSGGYFGMQPTQEGLEQLDHGDLRRAYQTWIERESRTRLAYGWLMLEMEISLFFDCQPLLRTSEMLAVLPSSENLWLASNPEQWRQALRDEFHDDDWRIALKQSPKTSLRDLFQILMDDELDRKHYSPSLLHVRLLLYPIHALVSQLGHLLDSGLDQSRARGLLGLTIQSSSTFRFSEIRILLDRWLARFQTCTGYGARFDAMKAATIMLYHAISLNLFVSFRKVEQLARRHKPTLDHEIGGSIARIREHALVHAGQILRVYNQMKDEMQPIWAPAAFYRATISIWACSVSTLERSQIQDRSSFPTVTLDELSINTVQLQDSTLQQYLRYGEAKLCLSGKECKVSLDDADSILSLSIDNLRSRSSITSFALGIRFKLEEMRRRWT